MKAALLLLVKHVAGAVWKALRWVATAVRKVFAALANVVVGNERRRFFVGSVVVPLVITGITVYVGARVVSGYQDWQDRRSRIRDNIESLQEATTTLGRELDTLAQRGSSLEKNRARGVSEEASAVKTSLARIESMSRVLAKQAESETIPRDHATLPAQLAVCRQVVDGYTRCLVDRLKREPSATDELQCTPDFNKGWPPQDRVGRSR